MNRTFYNVKHEADFVKRDGAIARKSIKTEVFFDGEHSITDEGIQAFITRQIYNDLVMDGQLFIGQLELISIKKKHARNKG